MPNFSCANVAIAVTPSDTVNYDNGRASALFVGVAGDVTLISNGVAVLFKNASGVLPVHSTRVNATATTATNIVALY